MSWKTKGIFRNLSIHMVNHCGELVCIFSRQTQHAEKTDLNECLKEHVQDSHKNTLASNSMAAMCFSIKLCLKETASTSRP